MNNRRIYYAFVLALGWLVLANVASAQERQPQGAPTTFPTAPQRDTSTNKTNTNEWHNEQVSISFRQLHSEKLYEPDTTIHTFHRRPFSQPWYRNLGNHGGPTTNLLFTPEYRVGPTLGYHIFDVYRFDVDSIYYYNTNRPYSTFTFQLGSKQEQTAELLHTQNIQPNWNIAARYRKITSPGYYNIQRTNHDNAYLSTNYQSRDQHYELYSALVYNLEQNDENGGVVSASFLDSPDYEDPIIIPVNFQNDNFGTNTRIRRSAVSNTLRDFSFMVNHRYAFGRTDTLYNEDSTYYKYKFTPRFGITHRFQAQSQKYRFRDFTPDSLRYDPFFQHSFIGDGLRDSVMMTQRWIMFDNQLLLGGFLGKYENQLRVNAGVGIRHDKFTDEYPRGNIKNAIWSNYVIADATKDAVDTGSWFYNAKLIFYTSGEAAGNSLLQAELGKNLSARLGNILAGFRQEINNAPYNYTTYQTDYDTILATFNKESVTRIYGTIENDWLKLSGGVRSYLISNYIYLDEKQLPAQYAPSFNLTQVWLRKVFRWRAVVLDNELAYQQVAGGGPVNVPLLLGRHQLSIETAVFRNLLQIATGVEARYHSPYHQAGYAPLFARFLYQNSVEQSNTPEVSAFFNFRIKRFRAYVMADQLQLMLNGRANAVAAPIYGLPNTMIRFGFTWTLIN
ncbi:putative porin [Polluticoccus soli]|uniref:putative porin n=1 Tax=Polluticoccus soli TaxID=3034150 RepID=UPI0023E1B2C5|nr:putative porin [Flavipsychrobacter sp. JY13-12]